MACKIKTETKYKQHLDVFKDETKTDHIISLNGDNYLEYTEKGIESLLFTDLYNLTNDFALAYTIKAKFLSETFKEENKEFLAQLKETDYYTNGEIKAKVLFDYINKKENFKFTNAMKEATQKTINALGLIEIEMEQSIADNKPKSDVYRLANLVKNKIKSLTWFDKDNVNIDELKKISKLLNSKIGAIELQMQSRATQAYSVNLHNTAKVILEESFNFINTIKEDGLSGFENKRILQTFLSYNKDFRFIIELLSKENLEEDDTMDDADKADIARLRVDRDSLLSKLSKIDQEFNDVVKPQIMKSVVSNLKTEMNLDSFVMDSIIDANGNIIPQKRDKDFFNDISEWLRNNALDLTKSNNPIIQLLGNFAVNTKNYFSNNIRVKMDTLKTLDDELTKVYGKGDKKYEVFYQKDKNGNPINKLIEKYDFNYKEYYSFDDGGKLGVKNSFLKNMNESNQLEKFKVLFNYYAKTFNVIPVDKNHRLYEKWQSTYDDFNLEMDTIKEKINKFSGGTSLEFKNLLSIQYQNMEKLKAKMKGHLNNNPYVITNLFEAHKQGKLSSTFNLKEALKDAITSEEYDFIYKDSKNKVQETASLMSLTANKHILKTNFKFDSYLSFNDRSDLLLNDQRINPQYKELEARFQNEPILKQYYENAISLLSDNSKLMPMKDNKGNTLDPYDLFEAKLTFDEEIAAKDGYLPYLLSVAKNKLIDNITQKSNVGLENSYNPYTNKFEPKVSKPYKRDVPFEKISHNLTNVLAEHTALANAFASKKEIEPMTKFVQNYLEDVAVIENGKEVRVKSEKELVALESFANQMLYGKTTDSPEKFTSKYLNQEDYKLLTSLKEQKTIVNKQISESNDEAFIEPKIKELEALESKIRTLENKAVSFSKVKTMLAANKLAKIVVMGGKASVAIVDGFTGVVANIAEAATNKHFNMGDYLFALWETFKYITFGSAKVDKLMKLNHVDSKMSEIGSVKKNKNISVTSLAYLAFNVSSKFNVLPIMIGKLRNEMIDVVDSNGNIIKDENGEAVQQSIWDSFNEKGDFKNSRGNPYVDDNGKLTIYGANLSSKIGHIIDTTHGNMSDVKPTVLTGSALGQVAMTFKRWGPNVIENLVSDERVDIMEGGKKAGQITATYRMLKSDPSNIFKLIYAPFNNIILGGKTKFEGQSSLNTDQIVRLQTKIQLYFIFYLMMKMFKSALDEEDEVEYVYDEELNKYKKIRHKDKEYEMSSKSYLYNVFKKLEHDINPLSPGEMLYSNSGNIIPLLTYMNGLKNIVAEQMDDEFKLDDVKTTGTYKGWNETFYDVAKKMPIGAGMMTEWDYMHDRDVIEKMQNLK